MNVALIEFNPFHDECLYSQVKFIRSDPANKVFLVYNRNLRERISFWDEIDDNLSISSNQWGIGYLRILNFLRKNKVDYVVFNSLHSPQVNSLMQLARYTSANFFGVVHDLNDLIEKQTKLIHKHISGYFVLNDYLVARAKKTIAEELKIASFYPIFFPKFPSGAVTKPKDEIWIAIPGLMEPWRRDYDRLIDSLEKNQLAEQIRLLFLGKSTDRKGRKMNIRKSLEALDRQRQFVFWDGFVDQSTFQTYLKLTDYLMPLLHANTVAAERYQDKITGLYNLGFSYGKRFVMENFLAEIDDFKETAIFYSADDDLTEVLNTLEKPIPQSPYKDAKFTLEYQSEHYLSSING